MDQPLVSVMIITYNQKQFIHETLQSVLNQDYKNIEIIVADDGSSDGTREIILEYAEQYPTKIVSLVGGPNLGITGNSNRGLKACRGKYIAFMGGDDLFLPEKISKQVKWFEAKSDRVLCGHHIEVFYDDERLPHLHRQYLTSGKGPKDFIRHGCPFGATSVMVRANHTPQNGFDSSLKLVSDGFFFTETLMRGGGYGYVPGVYARYRRHNNNITLQWEKCVNDFSQVFPIIRERYPQYKRDADVGEANQIMYGYGLRSLNNGKAKRAITFFVKGIKNNPLGYKLWARLIQAIFTLPFNKVESTTK